jgi:hypothetical protein
VASAYRRSNDRSQDWLPRSAQITTEVSGIGDPDPMPQADGAGSPQVVEGAVIIEMSRSAASRHQLCAKAPPRHFLPQGYRVRLWLLRAASR